MSLFRDILCRKLIINLSTKTKVILQSELLEIAACSCKGSLHEHIAE